MKIRKYLSTDKKAIQHIFNLNTPHYFSPQEENDLIFYLENEIEEYFVIETDKKIIGSGGINYDLENKIGKISWDLLHPDFQGKGFGKTLVEHRLALLKTDPRIEKIMVRTSQLVFPFYEKTGFQLQEIVKDYWDKGYDLYVMELQEI